ncbi:MAG: hemolysin family protein [Candidatus Tritonobacter lacicola]|nr:hemolysin family protein [Candidatus Tritonobacter lacicola]
MQPIIIIQIAAIFILILSSAFFSGSETAFFSLSKFKVKEMEKAGGRSRRLVARLLSRPERLLITIILANMLVNIASSVMAENVAAHILGGYGWIISSLLMIILILIFGEITPKIIAIQKPEKVSVLVAPAIGIISTVAFPARWVVKVINDGFMNLVGRGRAGEPPFTREEIKTAVDLGKKEGVVDKQEEEMIHGVIGVANKRVRDIMKPRGDIFAFEVSTDIGEVVRGVREKAFSRVPVYRDKLDDIQGILYVKDLVRMGEGIKEAKLDGILRQAYFVPGTKKAGDLFDKFRRKRIHMAIVTDEYGQVEGLVTLEDILEEIFGEIVDKGEERYVVEWLSGEEALVNGRMEIEDFNEQFGSKIVGEADITIGGFFTTQLGRIPARGDAVDANGLRFEAVDTARRTARLLRVKKMP